MVIDDLMILAQGTIKKTKITSTRQIPTSFKSPNHMIVRNPKEYWNCSIIVNPDRCNNLYFKSLSHDKASWTMNIVTSEWYCVGGYILIFLSYGFALIIMSAIQMLELKILKDVCHCTKDQKSNGNRILMVRENYQYRKSLTHSFSLLFTCYLLYNSQALY